MIHLERPIDMYSSDELEFLSLRLEGAEVGWKTDDKCPSRVREVATTKTRDPQSMRLLEGGRWLLTASDTSSVVYFDLDASPITENVLIPDQHDPVPNVFMCTQMAIDVDGNSAFLAFNLALSLCSPDTVTNLIQYSIQVWNVVLLRDAQQRGIGLAAELLSSFPQEPLISGIYSISLCGPHTALSGFSSHSTHFIWGLVLDWVQANGDTTDCRPRMFHLTDAGAVSTIPPNI